jgi:AraC-like DNA-binding protein
MQKPNPDWTVYGTTLNAVIQAGERLGAPMDVLLLAAGLDRETLQEPERRFPLESLLNLADSVVAATDAPDLGLYTGRISYLNQLHLQLYMSTVCTTFREYLNLMPSVLRFAGDMGEVRIRREDALIRLAWLPLWEETRTSRFLSDEFLTTAAAIVNSLCIRPILPVKACFTYAEPEDLTLLLETFGENLHFEQEFSCLYFPRDSLDYPLTQLNRSLSESLKQPIAHLFDDGAPDDAFLLQLRTTLLNLLPAGEAGVDEVASRLNVSRRTLQRRLADRDTNFQQYLQNTRAQLALSYLADQHLGITDIAFLLGYADQGSFSSAFKSWHGTSPREYRQTL